MAVKHVEMTARKRSSCRRCDEWIKPGERIIWETSDAGGGSGSASHKECPVDVVGARARDCDAEDFGY